MYVDVPKFKRCCCCIPLRLGLVAWGYFKLVIMIALASLIDFEKVQHEYIIFVYVFASLDITFNVMFVVGAHLKHVKILKVYFYYSIAIFTLYIVITGVVIASLIFLAKTLVNHFGVLITVSLIGGKIGLHIIEIVIQAYLTLLVRSEIFKLENNLQFKFVTATGEAACRLDADDKETQGKVKYDKLESEDCPTLTV